MRLFRKRRVPPEVTKAQEAVEEARKAQDEADRAVQQYWTVQRQYAKAETTRRHPKR